MATIDVQRELLGRIRGEIVVLTWPNMNAGDVGEAVDYDYMADRTVQVSGDFAGDGSVVVKGTLETNPAPANWITLNDPQGSPLSFTAAGLKSVAELVKQVRPEAVGGTQPRTVRLLVRKTLR